MSTIVRIFISGFDDSQFYARAIEHKFLKQLFLGEGEFFYFKLL